ASGYFSKGSNNVFVGRYAGLNNVNGDSCVFLGHSAGALDNNSHRLYIENSEADNNNSLIYGKFDDDYLQLNAEVNIGNHFIVDHDGKVGIGTLTPELQLHVQGTDTTTGGTSGVAVKIQNNDNSDGTLSALIFESGTTNAKAGIMFRRNNTYGRGDIIFANSNSASNEVVSTADSRMVITRTGRIGIGMTDPSCRLEVVANNTNNYASVFNNEGGTANSYGLKIQAGNTDGSGTNYMIRCFDGDGDFEGGIALTDGTLELVQNSDKNLKKNIEKTKINGLDIINQLEVVDYKFVDCDNQMHTGYIAQDAKKIYPDLVYEDKETGYYGIALVRLIPVMNKAIQDLSAEMQSVKTEQQQQIEMLIKKNEELAQIIKTLSKQIENQSK
ncbi:MAG: tail fiber domain-containing protein, partial [Bacteroidetes bacterium]|nr:tail fiber domain-containing protein [Bacteroidota bacterium]